ncbi:MAG: hypothetical protein HFH35_14225 [Eubacterium sp.]|nr:hypothetical protein [Eubacterium sp.]
MENWRSMKKTLLLAVKIAIGSSVAIYIAQEMQMEYPISAGTITLLTLLTTKWETVKLSAFRLVMFAVSVLAAWLAFTHFDNVWCSYGVFIFVIVFLCEAMGWRATLSVNSVTGAHLLTNGDFTDASIWNEFLLVMLGVSVAFVLNLFHDNHSREKDIISNMRYTENKLQVIINSLALCLLNGKSEAYVCDDICLLEKRLHGFLENACEFQENTFLSHPAYYIEYFEMRQGQCQILRNLYYEMEKVFDMPKQAAIIAEYMKHLANYVTEMNEPYVQIEQLDCIFSEMKKEEMPKTRADFENRALLYHILMDIKEFLLYKARFIRDLDGSQLKKYWHRNS